MMGKILFIDVDGTLLNSRHEITQRTVETLKRAVEAGHRIVISSGRCADGMAAVISALPFPKALSTLNGAYIISEEGKIISENPFSKDMALKVADIFDEHRASYLYFAGEKWGAGFKADYDREKAIVKHEGMIKPLREVAESLTLHKILAVSETEGKKKEIQKALRAELPGYEILDSSEIYTEINTPGSSKGRAVSILASYFSCPIEDTIAFGDYDNDIPMFKASGLGVCLANGSENAKSVADTIALSNDEDGLARWIDENIL